MHDPESQFVEGAVASQLGKFKVAVRFAYDDSQDRVVIFNHSDHALHLRPLHNNRSVAMTIKHLECKSVPTGFWSIIAGGRPLMDFRCIPRNFSARLITPPINDIPSSASAPTSGKRKAHELGSEPLQGEPSSAKKAKGDEPTFKQELRLQPASEAKIEWDVAQDSRDDNLSRYSAASYDLSKGFPGNSVLTVSYQDLQTSQDITECKVTMRRVLTKTANADLYVVTLEHSNQGKEEGKEVVMKYIKTQRSSSGEEPNPLDTLASTQLYKREVQSHKDLQHVCNTLLQ